jgi:uncharacterized cofD-like protein
MNQVVTVIGGGTGSFTVLTGLKPYRNLSVQSIVTMMDSGGDSGRLRDEFGVLPPGDIRRCLVALSRESTLLRDLFSFRFAEASLEGRSFGNLFFLALTKILGSEKEAIEAISRILRVEGRVLAVTFDSAHIFAELADGTLVRGEANIDVPKHDASIPIRRVYLEPEATANPEALEAIRRSDFIVLAPGNLYTSTIPNLLVKGVPEALQLARAPLLYVVNLMTRCGETDGYTASRHVEQIAQYGGRTPDAVLAHQDGVPDELAEKYQTEQSYPVAVDVEELYRIGVKVVKRGDVMSKTSLVRHDPARTARALLELFEELELENTSDRAIEARV